MEFESQTIQLESSCSSSWRGGPIAEVLECQAREIGLYSEGGGRHGEFWSRTRRIPLAAGWRVPCSEWLVRKPFKTERITVKPKSALSTGDESLRGLRIVWERRNFIQCWKWAERRLDGEMAGSIRGVVYELRDRGAGGGEPLSSDSLLKPKGNRRENSGLEIRSPGSQYPCHRIHCMTMGNFLPFLQPQFPHMYTLQGWCEQCLRPVLQDHNWSFHFHSWHF